MRVAVTGASGFVGRYVVAELLRHEVQVVALTRDAKHLAGVHPSIQVAQFDLAQPDDDCYARLGRPDVLIHLAWDGLPNYKSLHHFETELPRQYQFLKSMVLAGLPSMLVTGTCFEYGMQSGCLSEDTLTRPGNPYGHAKDVLRQELEFLRSAQPFSLTWARLFYMYGEGQSGASLYPKLCEAVARRDTRFDMSGGEQLRDYLPVTEVARQIVCLAMLQRDIGPVNVCSGSPVSVRRLVERWLMENDWNIALGLGAFPYPNHEPMAFWGDKRHLEAMLAKR